MRFIFPAPEMRYKHKIATMRFHGLTLQLHTRKYEYVLALPSTMGFEVKVFFFSPVKFGKVYLSPSRIAVFNFKLRSKNKKLSFFLIISPAMLNLQVDTN